MNERQTNMYPEVNDFTWQSLYELIESRIAGLQQGLQFFKANTSGRDFTQPIESLEHELNVLQRYIPLVQEVKAREAVQVVCPILSVNIIRLRCRHKLVDQASSFDFAWITSVGEERFSIVRFESSESHPMEKLWSFEGNLSQTVAKIETVAKELCSHENK